MAMTNQRIKQADLHRLFSATKAMLALVGAMQRCYAPTETSLRAGKLAYLKTLLREMRELPESSDYRPYEAQLKRRVVQARHRVFGVPRKKGQSFLLNYTLAHGVSWATPDNHERQLAAFREETDKLLAKLAEVGSYAAPASFGQIQVAASESAA